MRTRLFLLLCATASCADNNDAARIEPSGRDAASDAQAEERDSGAQSDDGDTQSDSADAESDDADEQSDDADAESDDADEQSDDAGAESDDAGAQSDNADASALGVALRALLTEYDREVQLRCPCHVESGDFDSLDACLTQIGGGISWAECIETAVADQDDEALRDMLRCRTAQSEARNDCLESVQCDDVDEISRCHEPTLECPEVDPAQLTNVLTECPEAVILI